LDFNLAQNVGCLSPFPDSHSGRPTAEASSPTETNGDKARERHSSEAISRWIAAKSSEDSSACGLRSMRHHVAGTVTVALPFFGKIAAANETSIIEDDRPVPVTVLDGTRIRFDIRPFGVKTIRIVLFGRDKFAR
jgi:hypothetical protein